MSVPIRWDQLDPAQQQAITANVAKLRAQNASDDDVEHYLTNVEHIAPAAATPAGPKAVSPAAAAGRMPAIQKAGDEALGQAIQNEQPTAGSEVTHGLQAVAHGLPLGIGDRAIAGVESATHPISYSDALKQNNEDLGQFSSENPRASTALTGLGSLYGYGKIPGINKLAGAPAAGVATKMGIGAGVAGGTAAAERFASTDHPDESLGDKVKGSLVSGLEAAPAGAILPTRAGRTIVGGIVGGALAPKGMASTAVGAAGGATLGMLTGTDLGGKIARGVSTAADKLGLSGLASAAGDVFQGTGSRGAVNRELQQMDDIAGKFGSSVGAPSTAGQDKIADQAAHAAQSQQLFERARNSPQILNDKRTLAMIQDPDIRSVMNTVDEIRNAKGNPLPIGQVGTQPIQIPARRQSTSFTMQNPAQPGPITGPPTSQIVRPAFVYNAPVMDVVPDPEALHLAKRIIRDRVDAGYNSESPIPLETALKLQPKLDALTNHLHTVSPEYKAADRFTQLAHVGDESFESGYGAGKPGMRNPSASALGVKDVAGTLNAAATQGHADPVQDQALRQTASMAAQRGAQAQGAQQIAASPLSQGKAGLLNLPIMQDSPAAMEQRSLALGNQAPAFENTLANTRNRVQAEIPSAGVTLRVPGTHFRTHFSNPIGDPIADALKNNSPMLSEFMQRGANGGGAANQAQLISAGRGTDAARMAQILAEMGFGGEVGR